MDLDVSELSPSQFCDLALEQQILKHASLTDFSVLLKLSPEQFYGSGERIVFNLLSELRTHHAPATLRRLVLQKVNKGNRELVEETLNSVLKSPNLGSVRAVETVVQAVKKLYSQRQILEASLTMQNAIVEGEPEKAYDSMRVALASDTERIEIGDYTGDFDARKKLIQERAKQDKQALSDIIPTGIMQFDQEAGGLAKGEVGVLIAATGAGKSLGKLSFAATAYLLGYNVVHFGLEMQKEENEFRLDSMLTRIQSRAFRLAKLNRDDFSVWEQTIEKIKRKQKNYLKFVTVRSATIEDLFAVVDSVEAESDKRVDLVILDHVALVRPKNTYREQDLHIHLRRVMADLTDWAKARKVAVWTSGQVTDEGISRKNGLRVNDVKYGRAIAEYAQVLVATYQTDLSMASEDLNFEVLKGRQIAKNKKIILRPDFDLMIYDTAGFISTTFNFVRKSKKIKESSKIITLGV